MKPLNWFQRMWQRYLDWRHPDRWEPWDGKPL